jgi:hypothetical protein
MDEPTKHETILLFHDSSKPNPDISSI